MSGIAIDKIGNFITFLSFEINKGFNLGYIGTMRTIHAFIHSDGFVKPRSLL